MSRRHKQVIVHRTQTPASRAVWLVFGLPFVVMFGVSLVIIAAGIYGLYAITRLAIQQVAS